MKLDELKNMQIPRGERIELTLRRDTFSHLGPGVEQSRVVGYFGRIDEDLGEKK